MKKTITLADVAAAAGVSKTTASRVINHRGYLSDRTIKKVHEAMDELNYRPNAIARQLFRQKSNLVALVFPTVNDPFFAELEAELEKRFDKLGYQVLMGNSQNNPTKEQNYLRLLLNHQVDGLIVGSHNIGIPEYAKTNRPIVSIERFIGKQIPVVSADNYQGGLLAVRQLLKDGCQHIIHTNYPVNLVSPNELRRQAYEDLMHKYHRQPVTYEVSFDVSDEEKERVFRELFREHPEVDGIFADNDTNASLIIRVGKEFGRHVPEDLKVVGFDGAAITQKLSPELSTIRQPIPAMADKAVELLLKLINGKEDVKSAVLPVKMIYSTTA
ncbi:LacI family DNA-binding transcriptional regulator [Limosilactobacillus sp.]|uniref:LacI family DNA-binding transcriptional regulator n=1 Tax=Limosilactobacillus sp. TaxID=2773925 RepID=UPI0035A0F6C7